MSSHGPSGDLPNIRKLRVVSSRKSVSAERRGLANLDAVIIILKQKFRSLLGLPTDGPRMSTAAVLKAFLSLVLLSTLTVLFVTIIAVIILTLSGCGTKHHNFNLSGDLETNPEEIMVHYDTFLEEARARAIDEQFIPTVTFYFTDILNNDKGNGNRTAAFCIYDTREVFVDRKVWQWLEDDDKEALVFHELGHCSLFRTHEDKCYRATIKGLCVESVSLMYPQLDPGSRALTGRRAEVLDELFKYALTPPKTRRVTHENCNH